MKELLKNITAVYEKNNMIELRGAVNGKKLMCLYAFYHYYYGDDDYLIDVNERCDYNNSHDNFAQGFFEEDSYEEKVIDVLIPYYVEDDEDFDFSKVKYMISQTQAMIGQMKNKSFSIIANNSKLRDYWDPTSNEKLMIKVITNKQFDYDQKNKYHESIINISPLFDNLKFDIVFGDDIVEEISQLTSDKKCVAVGELTLDKENNYLTYGEENSMITNIKATSLRDNFIKYGKAGLFAMNLRFYIANKKVDEGLERSIKENGDKFWYYNNGIIIVCDDYEVNGATIKLKNYSIVNGGQTTRMIGVIPFDKDFAISCKIIKNKYINDREANFKFISEVAEASNTQKPINPTDIIANRPEQRILKAKLADNKIFMQIKRGDAAMANLTENYPEAWQRTKNDELGQLLYASICQKPGTARNAKSAIFSDARKYNLIFGNYNYNLDYVKDLLFIRSHYKKWASEVSKDSNADEVKKGLVRNGFLFFLSTISLMAKFAFSRDLTDNLKQLGINSEKGNYVISQKTFNHRIFVDDDYVSIKKRMYELFELVYDKYVCKEYTRMKEIKSDLVYSNFTKTDKNYTTTIAGSVYDDFSYELNSRVAGVIAPLFYKPSKEEIEENKELVEKALVSYDSVPQEEETVDVMANELKERLSAYRTETYKSKNLKAYDIFTNKELEALVILRPKTKFQLLEFGCFKNHPRTKVKYYGDDIINIINSVCGDKK